MSPFGRGRRPEGAPSAEYVAAGPDLALVRVFAAGEVAELVVFAGGRVHSFDPLPGGPGAESVGFPVPLGLVRARDGEFRVVVDGDEVQIAPPDEAGARAPREVAAPGPDAGRELADARRDADAERRRREELEREVAERATAAEWLEREAAGLRERAAHAEEELAAARSAERAAGDAAE